MAELFNNLASSTLASSILAGDLSLTIQSGDGNALFPAITAPDFFRCVVFKKSTGDVEVVNVTGRSGDVFTISRAQEKIGNATATAFDFDAGDLIELRPTKAFFDSLAAGSSSTNVQQGIFLFGNDTGAADVYVIAMNPTAASLAIGQEVRIKIGASNTNTGIAASIKPDSLAAIPIKMEDSSNPPAGSIRAGFTHTFIYDGTNFIFNPAGIALTSTGFNALAKQIKNVAAGTANTDAATIGGTEDFKNKTITSPTITTPIITGPTIYNPYYPNGDFATYKSTSGGAISYSRFGWTITKGTTGTYTLNHNLNLSNVNAQTVFVTSDFSGSVAPIVSIRTKDAITYILNTVGGSATDVAHTAMYTSGNV